MFPAFIFEGSEQKNEEKTTPVGPGPETPKKLHLLPPPSYSNLSPQLFRPESIANQRSEGEIIFAIVL